MSATESDEVVGYASFLEAILSFVLLERMSDRFALTQISEDLYFNSNTIRLAGVLILGFKLAVVPERPVSKGS